MATGNFWVVINIISDMGGRGGRQSSLVAWLNLIFYHG
jgi:hypothetical protein